MLHIYLYLWWHSRIAEQKIMAVAFGAGLAFSGLCLLTPFSL